MNEEELKAIWKKSENAQIGKYDFERVKQNSLASQKKLRNKIKWDVATNVAVYILLIPVIIRFPKLLFLTPVAAAVWIWYLWEISRIYKHDADFQKFENVKSFLSGKQKLLSNYLKRTRYIAYLGTPFISFLSLWLFAPIGDLLNSPAIVATIIVFSEILVIIIIEIYIRKIYAPTMDELEDLLRQLNENNDSQ